MKRFAIKNLTTKDYKVDKNKSIVDKIFVMK
jgi:hypothetical protein